MLNAETKKLDAKLQATTNRLDDLDSKVNKSDKSLFSMSKTASSVGVGLKKVGSIAKSSALAIIGVATGIAAITAASAEHAKTIKNTSELMKESVEETQLLAAATNTVGIDMEKLGDISKDTSEKIGDFLNTGGGGMQDFADAMGMTAKEAKAFALSMEGVSGTDILKNMVSQMEAAGVSSERMSHALEGMASDTTALIPLLSNGASELNRLKTEFAETSVILTDVDIEKLGELSGKFSSLYSTFKGTVGKIGVEYTNEVSTMLSTTQVGLKMIGDEFASGALTTTLNSFFEAYGKSWHTATGDSSDSVFDFTSESVGYLSDFYRAYLDMVLSLPIELRKSGAQVVEGFADIADAVSIRVAQVQLDMQKGLSMLGLDSDVEGAEKNLELINSQADARDAAFDKEISQLNEKKELILKNFEDGLELAAKQREDYAAGSAARIEIDKQEMESKDAIFRAKAAALAKEHKLSQGLINSKKKIDKEEIKSKIQVGNAIVNAATGSTAQLFQLVKDAAASQIEAYGLTAGARALAELGPIAGPPVAASYIGWSQVAAGVVKALPLGGGGGGSAPGSSSGQAAQQQQQPQQQSFVQETSSQETSVNVVGDEASTDNTSITFNTDGGSASDEFLASMLNDNAKRGAINIGRTR